MNAVRILLVIALLCVAALAVGCSEEYASEGSRVEWQSTQTGFWSPAIAYSRTEWPDSHEH